MELLLQTPQPSVCAVGDCGWSLLLMRQSVAKVMPTCVSAARQRELLLQLVLTAIPFVAADAPSLLLLLAFCLRCLQRAQQQRLSEEALGTCSSDAFCREGWGSGSVAAAEARAADASGRLQAATAAVLAILHAAEERPLLQVCCCMPHIDGSASLVEQLRLLLGREILEVTMEVHAEDSERLWEALLSSPPPACAAASGEGSSGCGKTVSPRREARHFDPRGGSLDCGFIVLRAAVLRLCEAAAGRRAAAAEEAAEAADAQILPQGSSVIAGGTEGMSPVSSRYANLQRQSHKEGQFCLRKLPPKAMQLPIVIFAATEALQHPAAAAPYKVLSHFCLEALRLTAAAAAAMRQNGVSAASKRAHDADAKIQAAAAVTAAKALEAAKMLAQEQPLLRKHLAVAFHLVAPARPSMPICNLLLLRIRQGISVYEAADTYAPHIWQDPSAASFEATHRQPKGNAFYREQQQRQPRRQEEKEEEAEQAYQPRQPHEQQHRQPHERQQRQPHERQQSLHAVGLYKAAALLVFVSPSLARMLLPLLLLSVLSSGGDETARKLAAALNQHVFQPLRGAEHEQQEQRQQPSVWKAQRLIAAVCLEAVEFVRRQCCSADRSGGGAAAAAGAAASGGASVCSSSLRFLPQQYRRCLSTFWESFDFESAAAAALVLVDAAAAHRCLEAWHAPAVLLEKAEVCGDALDSLSLINVQRETALVQQLSTPCQVSLRTETLGKALPPALSAETAAAIPQALTRLGLHEAAFGETDRKIPPSNALLLLSSSSLPRGENAASHLSAALVLQQHAVQSLRQGASPRAVAALHRAAAAAAERSLKAALQQLQDGHVLTEPAEEAMRNLLQLRMMRAGSAAVAAERSACLALLQHEWQHDLLAAVGARFASSEKAFADFIEPMGALQVAALSACQRECFAGAAAATAAASEESREDENVFAAAAIARHMRTLGSAARDCGALRHSRHWLLLAEKTLQCQLQQLQEKLSMHSLQRQSMQQQPVSQQPMDQQPLHHQDFPQVHALLCCDLFVTEWEVAKTLHAAGDVYRALHLARRLCQSSAWPFSFKQLLHTPPPATAAPSAQQPSSATAAAAVGFSVRRAEFLSALCKCLCCCGEWLHSGSFIGEEEARKGFFSLAVAVAPFVSSVAPHQRLAQLLDKTMEALPVSASDLQGEDVLLQQQQQQLLLQRRRRLAADAVALYAHCLRDSNLPHAARTTGRLLSLWFSYGASVPQISLSIRRALASEEASAAAAAAEAAGGASPVVAAAAAAVPTTLRLRRSADLKHLLPFVPQIVSRLALDETLQQQPPEGSFQLSLREVLMALTRRAPFSVLLPLIAMERSDATPASASSAYRRTSKTVEERSCSSNAKAAGCLLRQIAALAPALNAATRAAAAAPLSRRAAGRRGGGGMGAAAHAAQALPEGVYLASSAAASADAAVSANALLAFVRSLPSYKAALALARRGILPVPTAAARLEAQHPFPFLEMSSPLSQVHARGCCSAASAAAGEGALRRYADAALECLSVSKEDELEVDVSFLGTGVTRPKVLNLSTYAVIPFSPFCGVLEWVDDAVTLGAPAVSAPAAAASAARELLNKRLLEAFEEVCRNFRPVLSHFFLEASPSASVWFARRLCYRRSLAAASIVGFVVGLGDRHLNNILLDRETGAFIHIDFGVMFDLGTLLPIPETVPFRLTRDILDALGCLGTEGPFKEDCCLALQLLRLNAPLVISVLEETREEGAAPPPLFAKAIEWPCKPFSRFEASFKDSTEKGRPPCV
ncbi:phosphatidylinositol 3-and 4-kinase domain-containing protein [Cyclospora cayetanensis]|uniref:Phosphatidylinositol 3-and 4-kinase domain-containing protein n=1 Tax=Cyclospora cayetanensis TaxID=88456 RepID=A0A1D3CST5_9EIME|nr:phosphatidylinositol 3-and 4-kinase domain-containing protein [Cyclospora cayetanensis]